MRRRLTVVALAVCLAGSTTAPGQDLTPVMAALVHAANYIPAVVAPGEIFTIFGRNLGSSPDTRVFFDDLQAPLLYVSETQINGIVPAAVASRNTTRVQVSARGLSSSALAVPVVLALPGIFTTGLTGQGQAAVLNQDLTVNSSANPAARGSVVSLYATGGGPLQTPLPDGAMAQAAIPALYPVAARIDAQTAEVRYAGSAPGLSAAVLQVNVVVPPDSHAGPSISLQIVVNGIISQFGATLSVQ